MNEVAQLPKAPPVVHSAEGGNLKRFQARLTEKYQKILMKLEAVIQSVASQTNSQISQILNEYFAEKNVCNQRRTEILTLMETTDQETHHLRIELEDIGKLLIEKSSLVQKEAMEIYEQSFHELQPFIDESFAQCADWRAQLPNSIADKLPYIVKRANQQFLQNKQALIQRFYMDEIQEKSALEESLKGYENLIPTWKKHRYATLVADAKERLDPKYPIEFGTIFQDFCTDQDKFRQCCEKIMQDVAILAPPAHFEEPDFQKWESAVDEILVLHDNFIKQFRDKIHEKILERIKNNQDLITNLEKQLLELAEPEVVNHEILFMRPILECTEKFHNKFYDKLCRYWSNREEALAISYNSIRTYYRSLYNDYQGFKNEIDANHKQLNENITNLDKEMNSSIDQYEKELAKKVSEINNMVVETDIQKGIEECKELLNHISEEYRNFYSSSIALFDERPKFICEVFEQKETSLINSLKMRKTASANDFEAAQASKKNPRKSSMRSPRRTARGKDKKVQSSIFQFELENGSKFEEIQPLTIMQKAEEFVDEDAPMVPVKGKRAPKKAPPKRRGKKNLDEPEELEVPEITLFDYVPQVNEQPSIYVVIPHEEEIKDFFNPLRQAVISSINHCFSHEIADAAHEKERQELAEQLNERLSKQAPRYASLDLNVGEARMRLIQNRQIGLEKHFRSSTSLFNQQILDVEDHLNKRIETINEHCHNLNHYIDDLSKQTQSKTFIELQTNFRADCKKFITFFKSEFEAVSTELDSVVNLYHSTNKRFMDNIKKAEPPYSKEEKDVIVKFFDKMNNQFDNYVAQIKEKAAEAKTVTEAEEQKLEEDFNDMLPHHKADVVFLETLQQAQVDAKKRYDSLRFKNKQSEQDVVMAMDVVAKARVMEGSYQARMNKQFESIDLLRILLIRRAKYLAIMKSDVSSDPIVVSVELSKEQSTEEEMPMTPAEKKRLLRQKSMKLKKSTSQVLNTPVDPPLDLNSTMRAQIDQIGTDFIAQITQIASQYYKKVKSRKFNITRPELISESQNDCIKDNKKVWRHTIEDSNTSIDESAQNLALQIMQSVESIKQSIILIYNLVMEFYHHNVLSKIKEVEVGFKQEKAKFKARRDTNKSKLVPKLADPNFEEEFKTLVRDEEARFIEEKQLNEAFNDNVISIEKAAVDFFLYHLPEVTKGTLQMLDAFPYPEDLVTFHIENAPRNSIRQLLKAKERESNTVPDGNRPFHRRQWEQLSLAMPALESVMSLDIPSTSQSNSRRGGRRTTRFNSKSLAQQEIGPEKTMMQVSLDTILNRIVIRERNNCYQSYDDLMRTRLDTFKETIEDIRRDTYDFAEHWRLNVRSLKPTYIFQPL